MNKSIDSNAARQRGPSENTRFDNFLKSYRPNGLEVFKRPYRKEDFEKFSVSEWRSLSFGYRVQFQLDNYHIVRDAKEGDLSIIANRPPAHHKHIETRGFDGYKTRLPIHPNERQPSLHASRFDVFNKTPLTLTNYKKPVTCHIGKMSPRATPFHRKEEDTSAFYDVDKEKVMNRLNT